MRERNRAVKKSITPPVATDVDDVGNVPGVAPISDNGSVDSSLLSHASESEGDIWGNNNYDDASNAHEGANLVPPDVDGNEGVQPTIGIYRIQEMMRQRHYEDPDGRTTILPAIIQPKNASARNCIVPPCQSCLLARAKKRSPNVSRTQPLEDREGAITREQYEVGDFVSTDQFICKTPRPFPTGY